MDISEIDRHLAEAYRHAHEAAQGINERRSADPRFGDEMENAYAQAGGAADTARRARETLERAVAKGTNQ